MTKGWTKPAVVLLLLTADSWQLNAYGRVSPVVGWWVDPVNRWRGGIDPVNRWRGDDGREGERREKTRRRHGLSGLPGRYRPTRSIYLSDLYGKVVETRS